MANNIRLSVEERDLLEGILIHVKENADIGDSMEFSPMINDILDKIQK